MSSSWGYGRDSTFIDQEFIDQTMKTMIYL